MIQVVRDCAKVSIVVPAFNASEYIVDFISSIIHQSYQNWELIIVDDGSTDNTFQLIEEKALSDERIHPVLRSREPKGSVTCRNIGQAVADGDYIIHFDADDIVEPYALEQRVCYMENNLDIDYATFPGESITINSGKVEKIGRSWGHPTCPDLLESFLRVKYPFSVWNNIYRANVFRNILWDEKVKIYTDFSYIVPTIIKGYRHAFVSEAKVDYLYRVGVKNAMTSSFISDEKYESTKYLFSKTLDSISELDNGSYLKKCYNNFFLLYAQRVFRDGSIEQMKDYYEYYLDKYKEHTNIRLKTIYHFLHLFKHRGSFYPKMVNGMFLLFYDSSTLIKLVYGKFKR